LYWLALGLFICSCKKKNQEQLKPGEPKTVVTPPEQINTTVEQKLQPSESNKPKMGAAGKREPAEKMFVRTPPVVEVPILNHSDGRPTDFLFPEVQERRVRKEVTASDRSLSIRGSRDGQRRR